LLEHAQPNEEKSMPPSSSEARRNRPDGSPEGSHSTFPAMFRYVRRHPFRVIAALTAGGALINAQAAVALGVVASVAVLLAAPNGLEARRDLERRLRQLGRGAVTETRESGRDEAR
jgi:hypothetical protein